jgi:chromosome segregation ATPase
MRKSTSAMVSGLAAASGGLALLAWAATSGAQTARSGGAANPQAAMQLQQMSVERAQLQAENGRIKAELEQARKERDSLKGAQEIIARKARGSEAELARALADKARLEGELARESSRVQELVTRFRETADTMREVESDRGQKAQSLMQREEELKVCTERNAKMYQLGTEIIAKLQDQGLWSALARREPFTQLKRVELENLADGYKDALNDNQVRTP